METENETLVQDCIPENLDHAPVQDEYAPVIFAQETVSHIVSIDMMSGKVWLAQLTVIQIIFLAIFGTTARNDTLTLQYREKMHAVTTGTVFNFLAFIYLFFV